MLSFFCFHIVFLLLTAISKLLSMIMIKEVYNKRNNAIFFLQT